MILAPFCTNHFKISLPVRVANALLMVSGILKTGTKGGICSQVVQSSLLPTKSHSQLSTECSELAQRNQLYDAPLMAQKYTVSSK